MNGHRARPRLLSQDVDSRRAAGHPALDTWMGVGGLNRRGGGAAEKLDFTIDSDTEQGREVRERILDSAKRHGFAGDAFFALTVALEEAVINAIRHGNRFDRNKKVRVNAKVSKTKVEIMVEDEGPG